MNNTSTAIRQEPRDRLFFDQYEYRLQFYLRYAWCMRSFDHGDIDRRLVNYHGRYSGSGMTVSASVDQQHQRNLHDMCNVLLALPTTCKRMIQYDHVFLYSNRLSTLQHVSKISYIDRLQIGQAVVVYPKDTVMLINPVHHYRTFLRAKWWDPDTSARIKKFLLSRQDLFKIPKAFCQKLERPGRLATRDHHFVDHDNADVLLLLSLVCPGIINRTLPIQAK